MYAISGASSKPSGNNDDDRYCGDDGYNDGYGGDGGYNDDATGRPEGWGEGGGHWGGRTEGDWDVIGLSRGGANCVGRGKV